MATRVMSELPYGVGKAGPGFYALVAALLALVALGVVAYGRQFIEGEAVTGMRDVGTMGGATWGLYVSMYVYFMGLGFAGITLAAMIRLFNLKDLKPIGRLAEVLAVIAVVVAMINIIVDLGQPLRALENLFRYARPQSPFFGTFTLVITVELFSGLVLLYLGGRRDASVLAKKPGGLQSIYRWLAAGYEDTPAEQERRRRSSFWLALVIVPLILIAFSTVGFIFGLQAGRPGWFSALQAPGFVILAGVSGVAMITVIAAIIRQATAAKDELSPQVFRWLGNIMWILLAMYLYTMMIQLLTSLYGGHEDEARVTEELLTGRYAWLFWLGAAFLMISFVMLFFQFVGRRHSVTLTVLAGVLVSVAAIVERYLIVVPSQTHGTLLPYEVGTYSPTWVEYSVVIGLIALGALLFALFMKVFPIMDVEPEEVGAGDPPEEASHA